MAGMALADYLTIGFALLGVLGGTAGFFRSAAADRRSLAAMEAANEIAKLALPAKEVKWGLFKLSNSKIEVQNTGSIPALNVVVALARNVGGLWRIEDKGGRDLNPGDGITFMAEATAAGAPSISITWTDSATGIPDSKELEVVFYR